MFDERYDCVNKRRSTHAAAVERNNREGLLCQRFEHKQWGSFWTAALCAVCDVCGPHNRWVISGLKAGHLTMQYHKVHEIEWDLSWES